MTYRTRYRPGDQAEQHTQNPASAPLAGFCSLARLRGDPYLPAPISSTETTPRQINLAKKKPASGSASNDSAANLGFEAKLWLTADKLRNNRNAAKYKHVVLGRIGDIAAYEQESNSTTRRLAMMNPALRGIEGNLGPEHADTFRRDLHKDRKADDVPANPPFNDSDRHLSDEDVRWKHDVPPKWNATFAWVQHFIHHLSPSGFAGFVPANGCTSSNQSGYPIPRPWICSR